MKALIRKLLLESTEIKNIKYNTVEAKFVEQIRETLITRKNTAVAEYKAFVYIMEI